MDVQITRKTIMDLEKKIKKTEGSTSELPTFHHFAHGTYVRELRIPKGCVLVGKIHRYDTINILLKGKIRVATDAGEKMLEAPLVFTAPAGVKRAGYALEDTVWLNIHPAVTTDLNQIERDVTVESFEEFDKISNNKEIE